MTRHVPSARNTLTQGRLMCVYSTARGPAVSVASQPYVLNTRSEENFIRNTSIFGPFLEYGGIRRNTAVFHAQPAARAKVQKWDTDSDSD
eukprot:4534369-Prymnesium_polylepis.1